LEVVNAWRGRALHCLRPRGAVGLHAVPGRGSAELVFGRSRCILSSGGLRPLFGLGVGVELSEGRHHGSGNVQGRSTGRDLPHRGKPSRVGSAVERRNRRKSPGVPVLHALFLSGRARVRGGHPSRGHLGRRDPDFSGRRQAPEFRLLHGAHRPGDGAEGLARRVRRVHVPFDLRRLPESRGGLEGVSGGSLF
jgi:hypothetical protein